MLLLRIVFWGKSRGNYECFEPIMSNIYTRRVLAGDYMVINDYLIEDLISLKLWDPQLKDKLIANDGSIQNIEGIPQIIKNKYKTIWEIKQKKIIESPVTKKEYFEPLTLEIEASKGTWISLGIDNSETQDFGFLSFFVF